MIKKHTRSIRKRGFSILEIMIVVFFTLIVTVLTVFNYRDFDSQVDLKNQALDIALVIREAQVNALSARGSVEGSNDPETFRYAYGVFFDRVESDTEFILYVNNDESLSPVNFWFNDADWLCNPGGECIKKYTLRPGYSISAASTTQSGVPAPTNTVSINFLRPDPDSVIRKQAVAGANQELAKIEVTSPKGGKRYVYVTQAGQIYVE